MAGCARLGLVHIEGMRTPGKTIRDQGIPQHHQSGAAAPKPVIAAPVRSSTHENLRAVVCRYVESVQVASWPAPLRMQGERGIDAACQYGLGLIRMLAEFRVCEGIADCDSVHLATRLTAACAQLRKSIATLPHAPSADDPPGATPRRAHAKRVHRARRLDASRSGPGAHGIPPIAAGGPTAPPAMLVSAGTPAARGSGGSRAASCR